MKAFDLCNRVAVVTGGNGGIVQLARALACAWAFVDPGGVLPRAAAFGQNHCLAVTIAILLGGLHHEYSLLAAAG